MATTLAPSTTWSWSPTKATFYMNKFKHLYDLHGTWPADAVFVTDTQYEANALNAADGKMLASDSNGLPTRIAISKS